MIGLKTHCYHHASAFPCILRPIPFRITMTYPMRFWVHTNKCTTMIPYWSRTSKHATISVCTMEMRHLMSCEKMWAGRTRRLAAATAVRMTSMNSSRPNMIWCVTTPSYSLMDRGRCNTSHHWWTAYLKHV